MPEKFSLHLIAKISVLHCNDIYVNFHTIPVLSVFFLQHPQKMCCFYKNRKKSNSKDDSLKISKSNLQKIKYVTRK